ncbi:MAG TPA: ribulose-phosphate 3-epimerase [Elusimicrobia bacterium]|nr:ribulose-phosphate 3-epimerase [Elusimicrobiota bacterium]
MRPDGRVRVVPSLLSADPGALRRDLDRSGARWASLDVMDGHFVPNLTYGPSALKALRSGACRLDAHLMVSDPVRYAPLFAEAGADWVVFHLEACPRPRPLLRALRARGTGAGLAIKPKTPVSALLPFLADLDLALVMTVEPGFGGQAFMPKMLSKVRVLRRELDRRGLKAWLQVDGGIDERTAPAAASAGADSLVAGSAVFGARDPAAAARRIEKAAQKALKKS